MDLMRKFTCWTKLVLRLKTMYKTHAQDNTEIFNCVREKILAVVLKFRYLGLGILAIF